MKDERKPVWIAFPDIPWGSIGWRMGRGEDYWHDWAPWFRLLPPEDRTRYKNAWPEPQAWTGFYTFMETGALPPWVLERRRLQAEAAKPPEPQEEVIADYYRVLWLIREHMRKIGTDRLREDESVAELYEAPDGSCWRLSASMTKGGLHLRKINA